jgi:hypothetical protein
MRHTMGKKQKAAVQFAGNLEVTVNQTAPAGPADETAPAAAPPVASETQDTAVATNHTQ